MDAKSREMQELNDLSERVNSLEVQIVQLREDVHNLRDDVRDVRDDLSATRDELRNEIADNVRVLRAEIRVGDEETRTLMRVLHEDLVTRLALIQRG